MASKNARWSRPTNAAMSAESASDVSGPVATMSGDVRRRRDALHFAALDA